jgi:hypothetical protein
VRQLKSKDGKLSSELGYRQFSGENHPLSAWQEAACADHIDRFVAIFCVNLFHDATNVILHGEF